MNMEDNKQENEEETGNKSKLKRKIRAWCGLCFQFFENGPTAKNCKDHFQKGSCNLVECKKGFPNCVRKFPNINSENRHTYCLTLEEVSSWDENCNIQACLKGENEVANISQQVFCDSLDSIFKNKIETPSGIKINENINQSKSKESSVKKDIPEMTNPKFEFDLSYDKNNNVSYMPRSNHSDNSEDKFNIFNQEKRFDYDEDSLVDDFNKIYFNMTPDKNKTNELSKSENIFTNLNSNNLNIQFTQNQNNNTQIITNNFQNKSMVTLNYLIKDDISTDEVLDIVHNKTKVPKTSINKLKTAFKKSGYTTAKILRLKRLKENNWNFLYENFKDVCSQAEGVALYLESLLEQVN